MPQTLQCPKCHQSVTIGDGSAGKRVKCPHCEKPFLAPGFAATQNDDDDWLTLDEDPKLASPSPIVASESSFDDVEVVDDLENADESHGGHQLGSDLLPKFGDQLNEFTSQIEPLPKASSSALSESTEIDQEFMVPDLPPVDPIPIQQSLPGSLPFAELNDDAPTDLNDDASQAANAPRVADAVEYESEYRVKCNVCGSLLYAKARQAGKTIKCGDCFTQIKVPPPPRVKKKPKIDVKNAKTFSFEESSAPEKKRVDPYRKSAQDLLEEAEAAENETHQDYIDPDIPSVREWAMNVFGIFFDMGVVAHWVGLSILGSIPAAIALSVGHPFLIIGLGVYELVFAALTIACGFAIMQSVANKHETVSDWPEADPVSWIDDLVVAVSAALLAGLPVLAITSLAMGPGLLSVALTMFSIYLLFPFFVLSMMDMQSVWVPFSPEVARSVTRCQEAWGALYLSSGILFFVLFLFYVGLSNAPPGPASVISIALTILVVFSYFSMIGRLAYSIGQSVNEPANSAAKSDAK